MNPKGDEAVRENLDIWRGVCGDPRMGVPIKVLLEEVQGMCVTWSSIRGKRRMISSLFRNGRGWMKSASSVGALFPNWKSGWKRQVEKGKGGGAMVINGGGIALVSQPS